LPRLGESFGEPFAVTADVVLVLLVASIPITRTLTATPR
jgi:hypothetical protein